MKSKKVTCLMVLALSTTATISVRLTAQEQGDQHAPHHRYRVIDLGTLGGTDRAEGTSAGRDETIGGSGLRDTSSLRRRA
jgi:hypothetical protein